MKFVDRVKRRFVLVMVDIPKPPDNMPLLTSGRYFFLENQWKQLKKEQRELRKLRKSSSEFSTAAVGRRTLLLRRYEVDRCPSTFVLRPSGAVIKQFLGYRGELEAFLTVLERVATVEGVRELHEMSDEEAKKDDRFFPPFHGKGKIEQREELQRRENAATELTLDEFAGIVFYAKQSNLKATLTKPYRLLSEVRQPRYSNKELKGITLATPTENVRKMSDEELRIETCKLVHALEDDLGVRFAVTRYAIDFKSRKAEIVVRSSKPAGELSVRFSVR